MSKMKICIIVATVTAAVLCLMAVIMLATTASEPSQSGIVGAEHIDEIIDPETRWSGGDTVIEYSIEMIEVDGYWVVYLKGESDEYYGYAAYGIYENMPTEAEFDILWSNRMPKDELVLLMDEYGF